MGLLCAVMMDQPGNPRKRALMRLRAPVLLNPAFLRVAKGVLGGAREPGSSARAALLAKGLFFVAQAQWQEEQGAGSPSP
eukprot:SAG11_NODE_1208_length_5521_cov_4.088528_2_plen_80_part_00